MQGKYKVDSITYIITWGDRGMLVKERVNVEGILKDYRKITAQIKNKETKKTAEFPFLLKNNSYEVNLSSLEAGEYEFEIIVEEKNLSKSGEFTIIEFDIEKQFLNANYKKLSKIAEDKVFFTHTEEELIGELLNNENFKPVQKSNTTTSPLIDWWYLLIIIAVSLSAEWFMRKYSGMI